MYSAPAGYEINIVNYCDPYRITANPIFQYLRNNRIKDNKCNNCYLNIMLFLKNSMVQFRKNFDTGMNMNRAEKVIAAFYAIIDYIVTESSRRYLKINAIKFDAFTDFGIEYISTKNLINGQYAY